MWYIRLEVQVNGCFNLKDCLGPWMMGMEEVERMGVISPVVVLGRSMRQGVVGGDGRAEQGILIGLVPLEY